MKCGVQHLQQVYQAHLKINLQKPGDTLQQYETEVAWLVHLPYPTASVLGHFMVPTFIHGVRETEIQQSLRPANPSKIDDALARALEFGAAKQAC